MISHILSALLCSYASRFLFLRTIDCFALLCYIVVVKRLYAWRDTVWRLTKREVRG